MSAVVAAVILAGGQGRRLGVVDKPALRLGERTLLDTALRAVAGCSVVVVGPDRDLPDGIITTRENPAGGGPAAAVAAGMAALPVFPDDSLVAVLAADLPGITTDTIVRLSAACAQAPVDGAVLVDERGHRQYLIGVWRLGALTEAVSRRADWHGAALRDLLRPIEVVEITGSGREAHDVDTPDDWRQWQS